MFIFKAGLSQTSLYILILFSYFSSPFEIFSKNYSKFHL
ncbi:hypothetical protein EU96_1976 [Prochlorococcus marinus str. MIT 9302]|uniref:Uncharacterized protein n=1 Tax=Prochlorococcus marinus str. MIT 9302 TaxID=74545 RepID=A0A0A2A2W7_PROMR|nr:hypothetical protein EU96_1976 [Prochlorococcus marinus str. MIT 9302]